MPRHTRDGLRGDLPPELEAAAVAACEMKGPYKACPLALRMAPPEFRQAKWGGLVYWCFFSFAKKPTRTGRIEMCLLICAQHGYLGAADEESYILCTHLVSLVFCDFLVV